ncbi:hypothetical protein OPV22_014582 [Ensete ventricosum]|uniref:Disease resistance N-terminal domain-containing protein n=1 Tax=Ensete ventricosum TaxID=4639 RepID=A0AAV8R6E1_ENSVE|nr:hypothetical protein OPV22_014582 [Ensete ventricosum]
MAAEEEMDVVLGVPEEIQKLQRTLRKIQLILHDAEQWWIEDEAIDEWLRELKDVMHDADDVLKECRSSVEKWTPRCDLGHVRGGHRDLIDRR